MIPFLLQTIDEHYIIHVLSLIRDIHVKRGNSMLNNMVQKTVLLLAVISLATCNNMQAMEKKEKQSIYTEVQKKLITYIEQKKFDLAIRDKTTKEQQTNGRYHWLGDKDSVPPETIIDALKDNKDTDTFKHMVDLFAQMTYALRDYKVLFAFLNADRENKLDFNQFTQSLLDNKGKVCLNQVIDEFVRFIRDDIKESPLIPQQSLSEEIEEEQRKKIQYIDDSEDEE